MNARRPVLVPALVAAGLVVAAVASARGALEDCRRNLTAINRPRTALTFAEPVPQPAPAPLARRVVLVVVDGLAYWTSRSLPELSALRARGVDALAHSHLPSISRPNYVSLLTGVPPAHSGVRTNQFAWQVYLDSLPAVVAAAGGHSAYLTDSAPSVAMMFPGAFDDVAYAPWAGEPWRAAERALARDHRLVVLLPGALDSCGHARRMSGRACQQVARELDAQLGALARRLDLSRDTLIITADHGHVRSGGHGGDEPAVMEVPLVMVGAGIRPGAQIAGAGLIDVAPTVAALLGVAAPGHGLGRPLLAALDLPADAAAMLARSAAARVERNRAVVEREARRGAASVRRARRAGVEPLLAVLLGLGAAAVALHRRRLLALSARSVLGGLLSVPVTGGAMFLACDCLGSLSCFSNQGEWRSRGWMAAAVAMAVLGWAARAAVRGCARADLVSGNAVSAVALATLTAWQLAVAWLVAPGAFVVVPADGVLFVLVATPALALSLSVALVAWRLLDLVVWVARLTAPATPPPPQRAPGAWGLVAWRVPAGWSGLAQQVRPTRARLAVSADSE